MVELSKSEELVVEEVARAAGADPGVFLRRVIRDGLQRQARARGETLAGIWKRLKRGTPSPAHPQAKG